MTWNKVGDYVWNSDDWVWEISGPWHPDLEYRIQNKGIYWNDVFFDLQTAMSFCEGIASFWSVTIPPTITRP